MLAFIEGEVIYKEKNSAVIKANSLGYRIFLSENNLTSLKIGSQVSFCLYHHIKEEASDLYGFLTWKDLNMFSLLLSVSGVGPKSAMGILSTASINDISSAILSGEAELLTKVAGIGKKTAARLVLELKNKLVDFDLSKFDKEKFKSVVSDELDALVSLGYSVIEAREALFLVDKEIKDSGERVKAALKIISNRS